MTVRLTTLLWLGALFCVLAGFLLLWTQPTIPGLTDAEVVGAPLLMNAPRFTYSPGWQVSERGADPVQPADPWTMPSGTVTFTITGADLFLRLGVGDYWGYLYATVDGQPANALPSIPGNRNSLGQLAGYRTFYAPEQQTATGPGEVWSPLYRGLDPELQHTVRLEVWRGWGQTPLRGVATLSLPADKLAPWTGIAYLVAGGWMAAAAWVWRSRRRGVQPLTDPEHQLGPEPATVTPAPWLALLMACAGVIVMAIGVGWQQWAIALFGLALLGVAALIRPALWFAAFFFALPFYFQYTLPLLPARSFSLIDIGLLGALALWGVHWLRGSPLVSSIEYRIFRSRTRRDVTCYVSTAPHFLIVAAIASWALIAAFAAGERTVAVHEWRVVFVAGALMAGLLPSLVQLDRPDPRSQPLFSVPTHDAALLLVAWLAGATVAAGVALWQFGSGTNLITAEGVWRVRAFYGSPNNLALYLERVLAVALAFALFAQGGRGRLLWGVVVGVVGAALLLTFSKGALLLALPAMLAVLWLGGWVVLARQGRPRRLLWGVAGVALLVLLAVIPFLGAERFQRLLDFERGTGFLRLNLWRSAWQMALDHPLLGVGPDNFLYAYRSFYLLPAAWQEPNLNHPHNWVLDWWTRLGLPGLALALFWFGWMVRQLWRGVRFGAQPVLSLGLLAAVAAALAHGLIDASYALPDLMLIWVLIGTLAGSAGTLGDAV